MLIRSAQRSYHTWNFDSTRWAHYRPRPSDIIIGTYPKCGTTWMQQIVSLLIFQSPEPMPIWQTSPWIERRFPHPIDIVIRQMEAQDHRRFLKSHIPLDGLPIYDDVRYIHVARDGRDTFMSFHNHFLAYTADALGELDRAGMEVESIARPFPRISDDPRAFFHCWMTQGAVPGHDDGLPAVSFFRLEQTYWEQRHRPNFLLVHFNDLKADLPGEMRRVADFLGISVSPAIWPDLVAAASFEAMRSNGDTLMSEGRHAFEGGSRRFFFKGSNDRWRGVLSAEDLALYDAKVEAFFPPCCARWVANGRLRAGDPLR